MMQMRVGDRWGRLTLTDIYTEIVETRHNGVTDSTPTQFYEVRCECGSTKVLSKSSFPGRRKMRDCGCGTGVSGGRITAAYIDGPTYAQVSTYAREHGLTISKGIVELCRAGLSALQTVATDKTLKRQRVALYLWALLGLQAGLESGLQSLLEVLA